jgi:hypothetical protein
VILQEYNDHHLTPTEVKFVLMAIWVRILNPPFGLMNEKKGKKLMGKIGAVEKMDVDAKGKASESFLRARVAINLYVEAQCCRPIVREFQHKFGMKQ